MIPTSTVTQMASRIPKLQPATYMKAMLQVVVIMMEANESSAM